MRTGRMRPGDAQRPPESGGAAPGRGGRMSRQRKTAAVLRLLRGSLSLREIGQELYLSQNTIKTHTRAIYRKLGVSTRHDAIARGHDIDIF